MAALPNLETLIPAIIAAANPVIITIDFGGQAAQDQDQHDLNINRLTCDMIKESEEQARQIRAQADEIEALRSQVANYAAGKSRAEQEIERLRAELAELHGQAADHWRQSATALNRVITYARNVISEGGPLQSQRRDVATSVINVISASGADLAAEISRAARIADLESLLAMDSEVTTAITDFAHELKESPNDGPGTVDGERHTIGCEILRMIEKTGRKPASQGE